jgi:Aldo/keto reductase family
MIEGPCCINRQHGDGTANAISNLRPHEPERISTRLIPSGDVFGITDPKEGERAVQLAVDRGINFFDVSPYYGLTLAEERLECALRGMRQKIVLATKCGRYGVEDTVWPSGRPENRD